MVRPVVRGGLLLVAVLVLGGCGEQPGQRSGAPVVPTAPAVVPPTLELSEPMPLEWVQPMPAPPGSEDLAPHVLPPDALLEDLTAPPVTMEMMTAVDRLRAASAGHPDAGEPELSLDRTQVVLRWHGDVPDAVQAVVDDYTSGPFTVVVAQTPFRYGELRDEASRLITAHPGVVVGVGPRHTGDGIDLMIPPEVVAAAGGLEQAMAEAGVVSRFPLFPSEGSIVAAAA